jgi:hypothetical protein
MLRSLSTQLMSARSVSVTARHTTTPLLAAAATTTAPQLQLHGQTRRWLQVGRRGRKTRMLAPPPRVVLLKDVKGLGEAGDTVEVAAGRARNHLIPHGQALWPLPNLRLRPEPTEGGATVVVVDDAAVAAQRKAKHFSSIKRRISSVRMHFQIPQQPMDANGIKQPWPAGHKQFEVNVFPLVRRLNAKYQLFTVWAPHVQLPGGRMGAGKDQPGITGEGSHTVFVRVYDTAVINDGTSDGAAATKAAAADSGAAAAAADDDVDADVMDENAVARAALEAQYGASNIVSFEVILQDEPLTGSQLSSVVI